MLQGPNQPLTVVDSASYGSTAWSNPGNIVPGASAQPATVNTGSSGTNSHYLQATNFGFGIPSRATVVGVQVQITRKSAAGAVNDNVVELVKGGSVQTTRNYAVATAWGTGQTTQSYGGSSDLWGISLQPADVNASNFGVVFAVNGNDTASVYSIQVSVSYRTAKDLISLQRAYQDLQGVTGQDALVGTLVTAMSDAIEKYCRRRFVAQSYDELYDGNGDRRLFLRQYPIQSVKSVRYRPVTVLKIINNNLNQYQQARVTVTSTGLSLFTVASGAASTITSGLDWTTNPTLNALASAVASLGNGWSAQIVGDAGQAGNPGDYGLWPAADLYVPASYGDPLEGDGILQSQGAMNARGAFAELKMHTYELQGYQWDAGAGWLLRAIPYTDPELLHPEDLVWPIGINNFRIQYTAGYSVVPEAVQEACARWVAIAYFNTLRDPRLQAQTIPGQIAQTWGVESTGGVPATVDQLLKPFRRHTVGIGQS
jgi:hypothetical protein